VFGYSKGMGYPILSVKGGVLMGKKKAFSENRGFRKRCVT